MSGKLAPTNEHRATAILVGVSIINAIVLLFVSEAIYMPILELQDFLEKAYSNRSTVTIGVLIEWFAIAPCIALLAELLFPILRKQSEVLVLG